MPITVSDNLKLAAVNPHGSIPISMIEVYPLSGTIADAKGLKKVIRDPYKIEGVEQGSPKLDGDIIYGEDQTAYCPLVAFNFGQEPPLGIPKGMLTDTRTYMVDLTGYFLCKRPAGHAGVVSYDFGYVSTGYVALWVNGALGAYGTSPHSIEVSSQGAGGPDEYWLPIQIQFLNVDNTFNYPSPRDMRLTVFWKDSIDEEWRVLGADVTCPPGGRYDNLLGSPVTGVDTPSALPNETHYLLTVHGSDPYHFHVDEDMVTEYPLIPGDSADYVINGDTINITWNSSVNDGDKAIVYTVAGRETPYILANVNDIEIQHTDEAASQLTFTVPVTRATFDSNSVTDSNMYTYDITTDSFGVLRLNRMVKAYFGYIVDGVPEYVQRFTGTIQKVGPSGDAGDDSPGLELSVTCYDARVNAAGQPVTKIEDLEIGPLPNQLTYDIAQVFPESTDAQGPDGGVRPPAFDGWKLATLIRAVLYQSNFTSSQLWAKDSNGYFLIDDRGIYLERTPAYPYSVMSVLGARSEKTMQITGYVPLGYRRRVYTDIPITQEIWTEHAENRELPYIYSFAFDADPWQKLSELCQEYGLDFGTDVEGNVYLRYPDNSKIYDSRTGDSENFVGIGSFTYSDDSQALGNVVAWSSTVGNAMAITFRGVGIKLIFARPVELVGSQAVVSVNGTVVDGINELDVTTGDTGHKDWTDLVETELGNYADLSMEDIGKEAWYYKDGIHPESGKRPSVLTICNNLTYMSHTLLIQVFGGIVMLEGYMPILASVDHPHHAFDARQNLAGVEYESGMENMVNDVIAIGNVTGALGEYNSSRAVDMASISADEAPNYIGRRRPLHVMSPKLINHERAAYIAQHGLLRYRRGSRSPMLESPGLPWLLTGDCVSMRYIKTNSDGNLAILGLYGTEDLTQAQRTGTGIEPVPFQKYWIKETTESFEKSDDSIKYSMDVRTTSFPPLPAYEPLPEPDQDEFATPVSDINITIDGDAASYNPYLADAEGKYVNITFNLNWHASFLAVRVLCGDNTILVVDKDYLQGGDVVNVLAARTGFSPAGEYKFKWDGWIQTPRLRRWDKAFTWQEVEGEGFLAADGNYSIEIETHRYSTGKCFKCRAESGQVTLAALSEEYVTVARDRNTVYGATPFTATATPAGNETNPVLIYDDTNSGLGLKFDVHLDCPARVEFPINIAFDYVHIVPVDDSKPRFYDSYWFLNWREDTDILEPGDYTFYFKPGTMIIRDGMPMPFAHWFWLTDIVAAQGAWYVAWSIKLISGVKFTDKAGVVDNINIDGDATAQDWAWGGATATQYPTKALRHDDNDRYYWYVLIKAAVP